MIYLVDRLPEKETKRNLSIGCYNAYFLTFTVFISIVAYRKQNLCILCRLVSACLYQYLSVCKLNLTTVFCVEPEEKLHIQYTNDLFVSQCLNLYSFILEILNTVLAFSPSSGKYGKTSVFLEVSLFFMLIDGYANHLVP